MSVTGIPTKARALTFMFEAPNPKPQAKFQLPKLKKKCAHDPPFFEIIDEKISVSSPASEASASRSVPLFLVNPVSINLKNKRLSFASLRQIFTRIRKSFLLSASSASIQFAATEPEARTSCRTSSVLPIVLGRRFTNARTDSAKRIRSSKSRGLAPSSILGIGNWDLIYTGLRAWDLDFPLGNSHLRPRPLSVLHPPDHLPWSRRLRFPSASVSPF